MNNVDEFVKMLNIETVQAASDAGLDKVLGCSEHVYKNKTETGLSLFRISPP